MGLNSEVVVPTLSISVFTFSLNPPARKNLFLTSKFGHPGSEGHAIGLGYFSVFTNFMFCLFACVKLQCPWISPLDHALVIASKSCYFDGSLPMRRSPRSTLTPCSWLSRAPMLSSAIRASDGQYPSQCNCSRRERKSYP